MDFLKSKAPVSGSDQGIWEEFSQKLLDIGLANIKVQKIMARLAETTEGLSSTTRIRHLHMAEKEVVDTQAFGVLLDATRFGFVHPEEIEPILENLASHVSLPIDSHNMINALATQWHKQLLDYKVH